MKAMLSRFAIGILMVFSFAAGAAAETDSLPKITLTSETSHYQPGDEIKLFVVFHYEGGHPMRVFKDFAKSAQLNIGDWQGQEYFPYLHHPKQEEFHASRKTGIYQKEAFDEWNSAAPELITRTITGRVQERGGKIHVQLDGYGEFELTEAKTLDVYLFLLPIYPHELDSLDDSTNHLSLRFG
jgi:hypothetical protein